MQKKAPVVLILFNRPDCTTESFRAIQTHKPSVLYLIADGPRGTVSSDVAACQLARNIATQVDWECEVTKIFSDRNMGLRKRIVSGLKRVFDTHEKAIVLEDDCVAGPDFFPFCEEMLERYNECERVMCVTGDNFQYGVKRGDASYYFSKYPHCWGWATWARAWRRFDEKIRFWPQYRQSFKFRDLNKEPSELQYWTNIFDDVYAGKRNSWAFPWTASIWHAGGLTVTPQVNLVENIGFGTSATHTAIPHAVKRERETKTLAFPLLHEKRLLADEQADLFVFRNVFCQRHSLNNSERSMLLRFLRKTIRSIGKRLKCGKNAPLHTTITITCGLCHF
jgi:hypothetical protein